MLKKLLFCCRQLRDLRLLYLLIGFISCCNIQLQAITLERLVSREDPKFNATMATMNVGRDGNVYLTGSGYVLRIGRDGSKKFGGDVILDGLTNATANADGLMATANAHFNHAVNIYDKAFSAIGFVRTPAIVSYTSPADVTAGTTDFYTIDPDAFSIMHLAPPGRLVDTASLEKANGKDNVPKGSWCQIRVWEAGKRYYLSTHRPNKLYAMDFEGKILWSMDATVGGNIWDGYLGAFDVDSTGRVYLIKNNEDTMKIYDSEGKPAGQVKLQLPEPFGGVYSLQIFGNEVIVKRKNPTELFQVYDLTTGERKNIIYADFERVTAEYPSELWTAGQSTSFKINSSNRAAQWHIWATPFGDDDWQELPRSADKVTIPANYAGLYQLRIAPTLNPQADSEFSMNAIIEVRIPDSQGTISVWSPLNRVWWGRGEEIPVGVILRTPLKAIVPATLTLSRAGAKPLWSSEVTLMPNTDTAVTLPASITSLLVPGSYSLRVNVPGFTCVAQPIRIGPGMDWLSPFRVTLHGDYSNMNSTADAWSFADVANAMLYRSQKLGINQYVNRIFAGRYLLTFTNNADGIALLQNLEKRLTDDKVGVAPQKVAFGFADAHAIGAFGAYGMREWLLLVGMDTALPIGASFPWAAGIKPEAYAAEITRFTEPLKSLPGFRGWDWVANWWVADPNLRFFHPGRKDGI